MNGHGKSDRPIVPRKLPNKGSGAPELAEAVLSRTYHLAGAHLVHASNTDTAWPLVSPSCWA